MVGHYICIKRLAIEASGQRGTFEVDVKNENCMNTGWVKKVWHCTASSNSTTLEFFRLDTEKSCCGPLIDNVSLVPDPS
jgi:hypothetical protein